MKRLFFKPKAAASPTAAATPSPTTIPSVGIPHTTAALPPKFVVPSVPHPCPHEHIQLLVTPECLLLRPHFPARAPSTTYLRILWSKAVKVEELPGDGEAEGRDWSKSIVIYGIVGVLELFSASYLLVVSTRAEVGNLLNASHAVYAVKAVTAIPLVEHRATIAVNTLASRNTKIARPSLLVESKTLDSLDDVRSSPRVQFADTDEVRLVTPRETSFDNEETAHSAASSTSDLSSPSDEQPVASSPVARTLASRLSFWSRISKRTSTMSPPPPESSEEPASLDKMIHQGQKEPAAVLSKIVETLAPAPATAEEQHSELEDKIVKEVVREFTRGGMYFAYTFDITRSLQHKQEQVAKAQRQHTLLADLNALPSSDVAQDPDGKTDPLVEPYPTLPLWRRVDRQFWWNEWMAKPFVDAGVHPYVLPIMQGYYQVASFTIPPDPSTHDEESVVDYIIVSRRSRDRAGLRYQRRGIDEEAHVANFVETETIMRVERESRTNVFSYVQIRGSIPLFWTQNGYGLKPPPLLAPDRTHEQNLGAIKRHFEHNIPKYGPHHGKEASITQGYRDYMTELADKNMIYHEYDFHTETKGMKYENISKLIDSMERTFEHQGYLWISDNYTMSTQKGVFRVNCIDCLDRTNVVESAFARYVALLNPSLEGRTETDNVFNDVWANNGDAISRAYAGTSALKRDLTGMLNDGVNSLARMYTATFSDWFCQAVIDFMLGYRTLSVFSEFLLKLQSTDPRDLIRLSKIRAEAIATSVSRVLSEGERLLSGWTVFAPEELNTRLGDKFEEKVLLLTATALYIFYDYTLEKVKMYTRVPLGDINTITKGAYILSPLEEASRDPEQNAGFVVTWEVNNQTTRITSYSGSSTIKSSSVAATMSLGTLGRSPSSISTGTATGTTSFAAFKALPIDPTRTRRASSLGSGGYVDSAEELSGAESCREAVDLMIDSIQRACEDLGNDGNGALVSQEDVVGLAEAQRMTSMYSKMEYSLKRLLWLGG
ncbi:SacI homology domain-containing protein [Roridomyces roridus]|uniref:SacI homology domain-containing protein n=1 Tax=Roridomyces roridus TaxID=1738132 RepID=A0AAD7BX22_9AGAR|nr:SacI homology domain-containing protein [Roridomyces roridus]